MRESVIRILLLYSSFPHVALAPTSTPISPYAFLENSMAKHAAAGAGVFANRFVDGAWRGVDDLGDRHL
jgi:hypothetical protein